MLLQKALRPQKTIVVDDDVPAAKPHKQESGKGTDSMQFAAGSGGERIPAGSGGERIPGANIDYLGVVEAVAEEEETSLATGSAGVFPVGLDTYDVSGAEEGEDQDGWNDGGQSASGRQQVKIEARGMPRNDGLEKDAQEPVKRHPRRKNIHTHVPQAALQAGEAETKFDAVQPTGGSIAGGTTLTIWGQNLFEKDHPMGMHGSTDNIGSLQPEIRVFLGHIECTLQVHLSRKHSIKCVTPPLESEDMGLVDYPLPVSVQKMQDGNYTEVAKEGSPTYRFSSGATPELQAVLPQVAGPGDVLRVRGWTCSGIIEAEPVELVSVDSVPYDPSGDEGDMVANPSAWGTVCEPFPPHGKRETGQRAAEEEHELLIEGTDTQAGAKGFYGLLYKEPEGNPDSIAAVEAFLDENGPQMAERVFIVQSLHLPYGAYWKDMRERYLIDVSGYILIDTAGSYHFYMHCRDRCFVKVDGDFVRDSSGRTRFGYHNHEKLWSVALELTAGPHRIRIVHWAHLHHRDHSYFDFKYKGPDTNDGWQYVPQTKARAGVLTSSAEALDSDALRGVVSRSPGVLTPATLVWTGEKSADAPSCPGGAQQKLVEFMCRIPQDTQPGLFNLKFSDYHFGQSVEGASSLWLVGDGARRASVQVAPKITGVFEAGDGGLIVQGAGLDELPVSQGAGVVTYRGASYAMSSEPSPFHMTLQRQVVMETTGANGSVETNATVPDLDEDMLSNGAGTMGARGLKRETWFANKWPGELEAMGVQPSLGRSAELITPIEDAHGMAPGFAERLSGALVPPYTGQCRFRLKGTQAHHHMTENSARLFLSDTPLSMSGGADGVANRPTPVISWPGKAFQGELGEEVDLAHLGYEGNFGGVWSAAFTARWDTDSQAGCLLEFGSPHGNRIQVRKTSAGALRFQIRYGHHERTYDVADKIDAGNEHQWLIGLTEHNRLVIARDGVRVGDARNFAFVASQSRPYFHLMVGRCITDTTPFKGLLENLKVFNAFAASSDAFGSEAKEAQPPEPPAQMRPYYVLASSIGDAAPPASNETQEPGPLTTLAENNFNDRGDTNLNRDAWYSYQLPGGYACALRGWTHTRRYAKGFLRNTGGTAVAVVSWLQPGATYAYRVYQYASSYAGRNGLDVNGGERVETYQQRSEEATAEGEAVADANGQIKFTFHRQSHHVHLSGLALSGPPPAGSPGNAVDPVDLADAGLGILGGAMSFAFAARWDLPVEEHSRIIDFANYDSEDGIVIKHDGGGGLVFSVKRNNYNSAEAAGAVTPGVEGRYLAVVTGQGDMLIYCDGVLSAHASGEAPAETSRFHLYVGRSNKASPLTHRGQIKDFKLFKGVATWEDAFGPDALPMNPLPVLPPVAPVFFFDGKNFSGAATDSVSLEPYYPGQIGGEWSVLFTAKWDALVQSSRVIDIGGGTSYTNIMVGSGDDAGSFEFTITDSRRRRRHHVVENKVQTPPGTITQGQEATFLCSVTRSGQMVVYKDGAIVGELATGAAPEYDNRPTVCLGKCISGNQLQGEVKDVMFFDRFMRWSRLFPPAPVVEAPNATLLQAATAGRRVWRRARTPPLRPPATGSMEFPPDPVVYTDGSHERKSDWFMLQEGESYPFKLERRVAAKTHDTGPNGYHKLGIECRSLEGAEDLMPKRIEMFSVKIKDFPVLITTPASESSLTLSFRNRTSQVSTDQEVGPGLMSLFGARCSVAPPVDGSQVIGYDYEGQAMSRPRYDCLCGSGCWEAPLGRDGRWLHDMHWILGDYYSLTEFPYLHMCYQIEPNTVVNMLVHCKVGSRHRDQWFSIGMTAPNHNHFHHDRKRAAQWPMPEMTGENPTWDGQWKCINLNLLEQVMGYEDYERRFRDVDYRIDRHNPAHLANMHIKGIYLGTPMHQNGRWMHLNGAFKLDNFFRSKEPVTVTQTAPPLFPPSVPLQRVSGASTGQWRIEWYHGHDVWHNPGRTYNPQKVSQHQRIQFNGNPWNWGNNWCALARGRTYFEGGDYKFLVAVDDHARIYVDGDKKWEVHCCSGWERYRWSHEINIAPGFHTLEVVWIQGGGGKYLGFQWTKVGTDTLIHSLGGGENDGITTPHMITFYPQQRTQVQELRAVLAEVQVASANPASAPNITVSLPEGEPSNTFTARLMPPTGEWATVVAVTGAGLDASVDVGEADFNARFRRCPVVRYKRNGIVDSVYVRITPIPPQFEPYNIFTKTWASSNNQLKVDMNIYSSEAEARTNSGAWNVCNYDDSGVGYPRDCGPNGHRGNHWFTVPQYGGAPGLWAGASLEIYAGDSCPSEVGAHPPPADHAAVFSMNSTAEELMNGFRDVGLPSLDIRIMGRGGIRQLDLATQRASMSSISGRGPHYALDGIYSNDHHMCSTTHRENNPWWLVELPSAYFVQSVRVISRRGDGQHHLSNFDVVVDGHTCAQGVQIGAGSAADVDCGAYGSSVKIQRSMNNQHLIVCEVEVFVRDTSLEASARSDFMIELRQPMSGPDGQRVLIESDSAKEVRHTVASAGTRFFSQVSDLWFRMPFDQEQVQFGPWQGYICGTGLVSGCAPRPMTPEVAESLQASDSLALLASTSHRADGKVISHRRTAYRRWRLPPRHYTPEMLEAMSRAILGYRQRPRGWADAQVLLQAHRGHQRRFEGKSGVDPRDETDKLPWSSPDSWGGEQPPNFETTDIVYIPEGRTGLLDMDVYIRFWVIEGNLVWDQTKDLHLEAEVIVVNGGQFLIGRESDPYTKRGQLTLHGHWHSFKIPLFGTKGLFQTRGNIEMHGAVVPVTWTELAKTAYPGDVNITLREPVSWVPGDLIVIAATDRIVRDCRLDRRDGCQVEERYVQVNHGAERVITLARPLVYRHVAEEYDPRLPDEHCQENAGVPLCDKTQVRAEVGLLSRNIKVKGSNFMDGSGPAGSEGFGGQVMMAERGQYTYVEFHWMGQAFQMGRYPVHWHQTGLNPDSMIKGCAIHVTFNRGVTVHGTHRATLKDNVLYNHMSHGFFIEDGNEHDNLFENNLGMLTHPSFSMLNSDQTPATFWIRNPSNYFRHNHAAGSHSFGFWFDTLPEAQHALQKQFFNNTAHSNGNTGIWVDFVDSRKDCLAPDEWTITVPFADTDAVSKPEHRNAPSCGSLPRANFEFLSTTTWGNGEQGITLFETGHLHVRNHRSVSEPIGLKVWGIQSDNWPDPSNNWYGPTVRDSVYQSQSALSEAGWRMGFGIKLPWDDTLFITGTQFIGPVQGGHLAPCAECFNVAEGGYQIRTSKLRWHDGAGTPVSRKVSFPWQFSSFFFDADGTLTDDTPDCKLYGCYLHSDIPVGGMFARKKPKNPTNATNASTTPSAPANTTAEGSEEVSEGVPINGTASLLQADCMDPLVGSTNSKVIPDSSITASSWAGNHASHGYNSMWRSRINGERWCAGHNDANQFIEWDFGTPKFVQAIQTRGRNDHDQWVTSYKLSYTLDGDTWIRLDNVIQANRDRNTLKEQRITPFVALKVRLHPVSWMRHICMRGEVLGCDASANITAVCQDRAYLDDSYRNCRDIERSFDNNAANMRQAFCEPYGQNAKFTVLNANQACCACGGGRVHYVSTDSNSSSGPAPPEQAPVKFVPGGTAYLPPEECRVVDSTGGIVCSRSVRMQTVTIKNAGIWHELNPIDVHSDYGWAKTSYATCYKQYEFTVFQNGRHMLMPPFKPDRLWEWDRMSAEITMRRGDNFVVQIETLHNPDGYTVTMPGVHKRAFCDRAPVSYGPGFVDNSTLLDEVSLETDQHSASVLGLDLGLDLYKVAHIPLLDTVQEEDAAANWGYIQANESYVMHYWYPGMFSFLLTANGVLFGENHVGPWNGLRKNPGEKLVTRPLASKGGAGFMFSHVNTKFTWKRWDQAEEVDNPETEPEEATTMHRLEFMQKHCQLDLAAFRHLGDSVSEAIDNHPLFNQSANGATSLGQFQSVKRAGQLLRFNWSTWHPDAGPKPAWNETAENQGFGNVSIQSHWEVTLDEDVDFINKLSISGVLKFADKPGCCKLVARYVMVGAYFGRLEAGTKDAPFTQGKAHIVLKGHPLTPYLKDFKPHIHGSAKWMKSKFLAVQGTLSLYGKPRGKIWSRIAETSSVGDTQLKLESGDFQVGDLITIERGLEQRRLTEVIQSDGDGTTIVKFAEGLSRSYRGKDHMHLGKEETRGLMAAHVGLADGHTVVVEGEDTGGVPMCNLNETHTCPYQEGFPPGVSLHDFAKEMKFWYQQTGRAGHPNCRPCLACSEQDFSGYIIAMAYFHPTCRTCPKSHGVIEASDVAFHHASSISLYHDYTAGHYPYTVPKDFPGAWRRRPYTWWNDPIWGELDLPEPEIPNHRIQKSSFNNTRCGTALALATSGLYVLPTLPVTGNVFMDGGVGLNGASRSIRPPPGKPWHTDRRSPLNDNVATRTYGVGSNQDAGNPAYGEKFRNGANPQWSFVDNFLSNAPLISLKNAVARRNVILGPVWLDGVDVGSYEVTPFRDNILSGGSNEVCVKMWSGGSRGISDNVAFGCDVGVGFRQASVAEGAVKRMRILGCNVGIQYFAQGPDGKSHNRHAIKFVVENTTIYATTTGGGIGMTNPKVHAVQQGEPAAPEWWNAGGKSFTLGHSTITIAFHSEVRSVNFVGFKKAHGGVGFAFGERAPRDTSDADYHPVLVSNTAFIDMNEDSYVRFSESTSAGFVLRHCIQIDCDGRRNSLLVDVDGSVLDGPGTIVPRPHKFYDKLNYVDPLGFDTMEDLIPMPARYDRFGDAIPFPTGVDHGEGGNLEYECKEDSTQADGSPGCDVLFMQAGHWLPKPGVPGLAPGAHIMAVREDGGLIRLDALAHGWNYATGYVRTADCTLLADPNVPKPESQHARRYGRVGPGEFGTHINTTRVQATKGPVYTHPGVYRVGCSLEADWSAYKCVGGEHRHLVIEMMDWNHMDVRKAPVSVEVNDGFKPQGGFMNVLTGPAMYWPGKRLQTFHALGHWGLRHNIYFTGNPPKHLRLHLLNSPANKGVIACVYYGLPNMIYVYVNGQRKEPLVNATPTWDNLRLTVLTTDMAHGTHYYDRVGVETGRPGYLYAVVKGSSPLDFKVSHKVKLTTKIEVSAAWGGWKNESGDSFFNKGLQGLVRNLALLIGAPPTRVKILGEGSAEKGTFWNEDTTSKDFAEWMWDQNVSMAYSSMDHWMLAPTSVGTVNATPEQVAASSSLLQRLRLQQHAEQMRELHPRRMAMLQRFPVDRHPHLKAALKPRGRHWTHFLQALTEEEQAAVLEQRAGEELEDQNGQQVQQILAVQQVNDQRSEFTSECVPNAAGNCSVYVVVNVDQGPITPVTAVVEEEESMSDAVALEKHSDNQAEVAIEGETDAMLTPCVEGNRSSPGCTLAAPVEPEPGAAETVDIAKVVVDDVPHLFAPLGWNCDEDLYQDGTTCNCGCGIWDPDCDADARVTGVITEGTAQSLTLLDEKMLMELLNLVDGDGNANGIIDSDEILHLEAVLGQSALFGLSQRILTAQSAGFDAKSRTMYGIRSGNYALLHSSPSDNCSGLLANGPPLPADLATYEPVCVKDDQFQLLAGMATGHCALLPTMAIGSQCMVPGDGSGVTTHHNIDPNSTRAFEPSPEAVCGVLGRIFRRGQGVGGHQAAGVGQSSAKFMNEGGLFMPYSVQSVTSIPDLPEGVQDLDTSFSGGFSFYAIVRYDFIQSHMPIFTFKQNAHDPIRERHITAYIGYRDPQWADLYFHVGRNAHDWNRQIRIEWAVQANQEAAYLFTITADGFMSVIRGGNELSTRVYTTGIRGPFDRMYIAGGADGTCVHRHCHGHYAFSGSITDVRIWDRKVDWLEAVAGAPGSAEAATVPEEEAGDMPVSCITSQKNSWDFVCDEVLPDELSRDWGYGSVADVDPQALADFQRKEDQGDVTLCGASMRVKGTIYHGRFGDGLTGEYFRVRIHCHTPPWIFGIEPSLVKVDPTVDFDTIEFMSPYNEYTVRWTGKILVDAAGVYEFQLNSKDGSWLAVSGAMVAQNPGCHGYQTRTGSITLDKGAHRIAVLFSNRGPTNQMSGQIDIKYKGPDTEDQWVVLPQARLGSAPMRLSKLSRHANVSVEENSTTSVPTPGYFVYHEKTLLGVMPAGSCDTRCRSGQRKAGAAPFRFFCPKQSDVSFTATVNQGARNAMYWVDDKPVQIWDLVQGSFLEKYNSGERDRHQALLALAEANQTAAALLAMKEGAGAAPAFQMVASAPSPLVTVGPGEHVLLFQGRPDDDEAFALQSLAFHQAPAGCTFFLEGQDKMPDDC